MTTWHGFQSQGRKFWQAAQAAKGDPDFTNQAASSAILAVIAYNDALCLFLGGMTNSGKSHTEAPALLRQVCRGTANEREASAQSRRLGELIRQKDDVQYHGRAYTLEQATKIMAQAERFITWAETILS
jgi:hypothetical protein